MRFSYRGAEGVLLPVRVSTEVPAAVCEYLLILQPAVRAGSVEGGRAAGWCSPGPGRVGPVAGALP